MISMKLSVKWIDENDYYLVFPKMIFFLVNFMLYTTYTYQLDYLAEEWHLNITSSGFITSIPIISFFSAIGWSSLAQRSGRYKEIILAVVSVYSISFLSFNLLSRVMKDSDDWQRFTVISIIYASMSVMASALFPLLDHKMYAKLSKDERFSPEMFGRQRLWGTVGQGVAGFLAGWGIKNYGYTSIFIFSGVASISFMLLVLFGFEGNTTSDDDGEKGKESKLSLNDSDQVKIGWTASMSKLMNLQFVSFLMVILVASYARAIVGNYLVRFLDVCMHMGKDRSAFLILTRTVPEIVCYYFSKNMLSTFGVNNILLFAQLAGLVRVTTYAFLPEEAKWVPFGVEILRGVNNAFLLASGVRLAHDLAPVEAKTVAQGFFHGIFGNLTTGTAGILASLIALQAKKNNSNFTDAQIIRLIFKLSSIGSVVGLLFFAFFYLLSRRQRK